MSVETVSPRDGLDGPVAQSVKLAFRALYLAVGVLAVVWATGNIRPVPSDSRAVVERFGRVDRVRDSGLLLAWPSPIEQVRLLPARERQLSLRVSEGPDTVASESKMPFQAEKLNSAAVPANTPSPETDLQITPNDDVIQLRPQKDADNAGYFLTGDGSVVELDTTLFYEITNPAAYMLAETHVQPALRRLYLAASVQLAASRDLDDFLVARPDQGGGDIGDASARRLALRNDLVAAINRRLADLRRQGTDLGVELSRVDIVALLPPVAKAAFDDVLTASQTADQEAAAARTDATRIGQEAQQVRDQILTEAHAAAEEKLRSAIADTATITALEARSTEADRADLMAQTYHDRIGAIMKQIGGVTAVDTRGGQHLIVPGPAQ
ncbi:MAG TPA: SPFH domain-containing protein [Stellaceae bacterium]|jgi:regulator of protease activity HflC (stomatin/prohibitin superfamily)|nr:SPFH domain-containing protein [Stellaceae bacterium]